MSKRILTCCQFRLHMSAPISLATFPQMVHLTNICHLWKLATSWEWCTCTNIGYLSVPHWPLVNTTQSKETSSVCSLTKLRLVAAFSWLPHYKQRLTWVGKINVIWYTECWEWPSTQVMGTQSQWWGKYMASVSQSFSWLFVQYAHINHICQRYRP